MEYVADFMPNLNFMQAEVQKKIDKLVFGALEYFLKNI